MVPKSERRFIRLNLITIVITLLVILAGGVVRSTGSGMGCPDWPKCFDQYVPPTSASQLPADYKEKYVNGRIAKNERFAKTLERLGKGHLADSIRHDESIREPEEFNVAKTWTEYINRLVGALTGVMLLAVAIASFTYRKTAKRIVVLSILNIFVVAYQAWLGSIVVSTNLMPWIVTVHMLLALVILAILIYTYYYARKMRQQAVLAAGKTGTLTMILFLSIALSVVQIVVGTEVREAIDAIAKSLFYAQRETWVGKVGTHFLYHRDLAIAVLVINIIIYAIMRRLYKGSKEQMFVANAVVIVLLIQLLTGVLLANFALPPYAQAMHILFSTMLFGLQYYLYLLVYKTGSFNQTN
ncbi:COX15/CtaA family protein [Pedobacter deserti]|uniref:COX15/CtaA family protein n=1 Tax=Pedobacter deserti TaxID=2817382 RepID=UPI00210BE79D|nr:COX15/CtaA family protein [Pedobacter sp. SYSU D00382]